MIPAWSVRAKKAKAVFYREWNDIDIFIEDTSKFSRKILRQIVSRCFKDKYRVAEVFPLGGRGSVVATCEKDQADGGYPRLYLIDGDLNLILETPLPPLKRLFSLPIYCIENLLIDKSAIVEVLYEEDSSAEKDELEDRLDFNSWIKSLEQPLIDLFADYAICNEVAPSVETVGFKVVQLVSSDDGSIDLNKIALRSDSIRSAILKGISEDVYAVRKKAIMDSLMSRKLHDVTKIVSGKDYLLPLARMRMRKITKIRSDNESVSIRLAKYCDVSPIELICVMCDKLVEPAIISPK